MTLPNSIRVLHLIPTLGRGGAERQLVSLVCNANGKYEHIVCYLGQQSDFEDELRRNGKTVINLNVGGGARWVTAAAKLGRLLKLHRPDIVQTWLFDANISARLSQLVAPSVPLVTSLQNADYDRETILAANWPRLKSSTLRYIDQFTAQRTNSRFVACSNFVKRSAMEHLRIPESLFEVIYNSVDPATLRCESGEPQRLRDSFLIPPDGFVFLNIGRLDPQKGQQYLLRAFQKFAAAKPNVFLAIAGAGEEEKHLRELARELGISEQVRFLGRRNDVGACLEMADVFVFPSLFEGLPLALVEAMFKKLPCIVSRLDTLIEVVSDRDSGLLVAPGSPDELAAAMIELYADPAQRKLLGSRAGQTAAAHFHQRVTIPQWENLYSKIMAGQSAPTVQVGAIKN